MQLLRSVLYPAVAYVLSVTAAAKLHAQVDSTVKTDSVARTIVDQAQAVRGMTVFTKTCVECHTKSDVTGADFKIKWHGRPVWDLFDVIRTTMPDDNPGTLTQDQYVDVVAYLVRLNGAPSGGAVLVSSDTTGLKKAKMEILVPSPNIDSVKVDGISLGGVRSTPKDTSGRASTPRGLTPHGSTSSGSTPPRIGINHLFLPQRSIKH